MTIDFHSEEVHGTYATRAADSTWADHMLGIVDPAGASIADIGCGGGIYSRSWSDLGAAAVVGVDFSNQMVSDARHASAGYPALSFVHASATATGLPDASFDIVFSRALIHHLPELEPAFAEAYRILVPGGTLIVQDRTIEDVLHPATPTHLRGYFFERFPRLLDIERERRPASAGVAGALHEAGFLDTGSSTLSEPRRRYASVTDLQQDLSARTGRSILHALDDDELDDLIAHITSRVGDSLPIHEADSWTVWKGTKPRLP